MTDYKSLVRQQYDKNRAALNREEMRLPEYLFIQVFHNEKLSFREYKHLTAKNNSDLANLYKNQSKDLLPLDIAKMRYFVCVLTSGHFNNDGSAINAFNIIASTQRDAMFVAAALCGKATLMQMILQKTAILNVLDTRHSLCEYATVALNRALELDENNTLTQFQKVAPNNPRIQHYIASKAAATNHLNLIDTFDNEEPSITQTATSSTNERIDSFDDNLGDVNNLMDILSNEADTSQMQTAEPANHDVVNTQLEKSPTVTESTDNNVDNNNQPVQPTESTKAVDSISDINVFSQLLQWFLFKLTVRSQESTNEINSIPHTNILQGVTYGDELNESVSQIMNHLITTHALLYDALNLYNTTESASERSKTAGLITEAIKVLHNRYPDSKKHGVYQNILNDINPKKNNSQLFSPVKSTVTPNDKPPTKAC